MKDPLWNFLRQMGNFIDYHDAMRWNDEAARGIERHYLQPLRDDGHTLGTVLQQLEDAVMNAEGERRTTSTHLDEMQTAQRHMEDHISYSHREIRDSATELTTAAQSAQKAQKRCANVQELIAQAADCCRNVPST